MAYYDDGYKQERYKSKFSPRETLVVTYYIETPSHINYYYYNEATDSCEGDQINTQELEIIIKEEGWKLIE